MVYSSRSSGGKSTPKNADLKEILGSLFTGKYSTALDGPRNQGMPPGIDILGQLAAAQGGGPNPQVAENPTTFVPKRPAPNADGQAMSETDYLDQLAQSLLTDSSAGSYDYEAAAQEAISGIREAYGAEIGAIRQGKRSARKQTKAARKEVEHMYNALAKNLGRQADKANRLGKKSAQGQQRATNQGNKELTQANAEISQQESDMLKGLGLESTAGEVVAPNYDDLKQAVNRNTATGTRAARDERAFGRSNQRYMDRAAIGANYEGVDRSADLLGQLQDYVLGSNQEIAGLRGQRAQEVAATRGSIEAQGAQMEADAQAETWSKLMDYLGLKADIENTNFDNKLDARNFRWDQKMDIAGMQGDNSTDPTGQNQYLPDNLNNAFQLAQTGENPQAVANLLKTLFGTTQWRSQERVGLNGEVGKMTQYEAMALAKQAAKDAGLSLRDQELAALAAATSVG